MGAGRPKSNKPTKDTVTSVRLTLNDYKKIKKVYGSVQVFLDCSIIDARDLKDSYKEEDLADIIEKSEKYSEERLRDILNLK